MKTRTLMKKRWLQLAIVPLFSTALITGCGSSDDDDGLGTIVGIGDGDDTELDINGDAVPDAFQVLDGNPNLDTNGNLIADEFEVPPAGTTVVAADTNNNDIDDFFEASLTEGDDVDPADGIDDAAAVVLAENGAGAIAGGVTTAGDTTAGATTAGDTGGDTTAGDTTAGSTAGDTTGGATTAGGTTGGSTGGPTEVPTGSIDGITFAGTTATTALTFDGTRVTGSVDAPDAVEVALFSGIAASAGPVQQLITLNAGPPTFFVPNPLSDQENAPILDNFLSGSLFLQITTNTGAIVRSDQVLPPESVVSTVFTPLEVAVGSGLNSNGASFMHVNTVTGQFTAVATVNIDVSDLDATGNTVSVASANIHSGSPTGPILVPMTMDSSTSFSATGTLDAASQAVIEQNSGWFNITLNDGNTPGASFVTGQIVFTQP